MSTFSAGYNQLETFSRHIPTVLARQLIINNAKRFLSFDVTDRERTCQPSIVHFHGAILFVDISGFTLLSQRLPINELRSHINAYFKRIVDIVDCYGGSVAKFAGDALYIVWQTPLESIDVSSKAVVDCAFRCGNAINASCSNYIIDLQDDHSTAVLNLHSGLSIGFMTGLDVGNDDRWEFLLLGAPLQDVAKAEADATVGELIVSEHAHRLLCPYAASTSQSESFDKISSRHHLHRLSIGHHHHCSLPTCGCIRTPSGSFKIPFSDPLPSNNHDEMVCDVFFSRYDAIVSDCLKVFENMKDEILLTYCAHIHPSPLSKGEQESLLKYYCQWMLSCLLDDFARHVHEADRIEFVFQNVSRVAVLQAFYSQYIADDKVQKYLSPTPSFSSGSSSIMSRKSSSMSMSFSFRSGSNKTRNYRSFFTRSLSSSAANTMLMTTTSSNIGNSNKMHHLSSTRSMLRGQSSKANIMHDQSFFQQVDEEEDDEEEGGLGLMSLGGELRNVIVMFIHVFGLPLQAAHAEIAFISAAVSTVAANDCQGNGAGVFGNFINTEDNGAMLAQDTKLLSSYQAAITAILHCLSLQGGHLRQFIVDDKGCVAIATFGLRGAVQSDNAASAVATSHQIIASLRGTKPGLDAGIGIAYGHGPATTYCGLIGSVQRHEYAVLGPYVNLAARFMSKAQPGEVLCDEGTRNADRDRLHVFRPVWQEEGGLKVKGFEQRVKVFRSSAARTRRVSALYRYQQLPLVVDINQQEQRVEEKEEEPVLSVSNTITNTNTMTQIQLSDGGGAALLEVPGKVGVGIHYEGHRLFGREDETNKILQFLSDLHLQQPCRWVVIYGEIGYGKSALLTFVSDNMKKDGNDVIVLENSCTANAHSPRHVNHNVVGEEPFQGWKRVIRQMLARLSSLSPDPPPAFTSNSNQKKAMRSIRTRRRRPSEQRIEWERLQQKWKHGLSVITNFTTSSTEHAYRDNDKEMVEYLPLLSSFHILPGSMLEENARTKMIAVQGVEKMLLTCQQLLLWLMKVFVLITQKVLMLSLDNVYAMDEWSLSVLQAVHASGVKGVILLTTTTTSSFSSLLPYCVDTDVDENRVVIELSALDYASSKALIKASLTPIQPSLQLLVQEEAVYEQIFTMTGGNPLYIHEICKARLTTASANTNSKSSLLLNHDHSIARVQEVICFRFDRLNPTCQLILKIAAAACYYHHDQTQPCFTLDMLVFIMSESEMNDEGDEDDEDDEQELVNNLAQELEQMLKRQEFIQIVPVPISSSFAYDHYNNSNNNDGDGDVDDDYEQRLSLTLTTIIISTDYHEHRESEDEEKKLELMNEMFMQDKLRREKRGVFKKDKTSKQCCKEAVTGIDSAGTSATASRTSSSDVSMVDGGGHSEYDVSECACVTAEVKHNSDCLVPATCSSNKHIPHPQLQLHTSIAYINILEQATVFNLMLDDQKESLQMRIACYWEMLQLGNN